MNDKKEFLEAEPIGKLLFRLSIPTVVAQLINMLYNIVDRIYIGHMPGDGSMALTGVGVCMPLIMLVAAFTAPKNRCFSLNDKISLFLDSMMKIYNIPDDDRKETIEKVILLDCEKLAKEMFGKFVSRLDCSK